jgi:hypothetical protein
MLSLVFGLLAICVSVIFCYFTVEHTRIHHHELIALCLFIDHPLNYVTG